MKLIRTPNASPDLEARMEREIAYFQKNVLPSVQSTENLDAIALDRTLCRKSFRDFIRASWSTFDPAPFVSGWHIDCIAEYLEAIYNGEIRNLIINIPPRHMKSSLVSVMYPAWVWINDARLSFMCASYAESLSIRDSLKCRTLIQSPWYQSCWGTGTPDNYDDESTHKFKVILTGDQNQKKRFQNTRMGTRLSTSVGGAVTGEGADFIICFPYDEKVWTEKGRMSIGDIVENKIDVPVWSVDLKTGKPELKKILEYKKNPGSDIVKVHFDDGSSIRCTPNHKLWTTDGWVEAQDLKTSDVLPNINPSDTHYGKMLFVVFDSLVDCSYCLTIEDNHNFIVGDFIGYIAKNCDDLHNVLEGESDIVRDGAVQWWRESIPSRLNNPKTGRKIIIQQRVHDRDVAGEMLRDGGYESIVLPMYYERDHPYVFIHDPRQEDGELLWKERFNDEEALKLQKSMGEYAWAGQYQQRPSPREGGSFKKEWFKIIKAKDVPSGGIVVRGWDLACSIGKDADWTVGCLMKGVIIDKIMSFYVLCVDRFMMAAGATETRMLAIMERDSGLCEEEDIAQDPGQAGKQQKRYLRLSSVGYPLFFTPESGSKESRAQAVAAQLEIGNVYLVEGDWNEQYINEFGGFPNGRWDDVVDATSRAFHRLVALLKSGDKRGAGIGLALQPGLVTGHSLIPGSASAYRASISTNFFDRNSLINPADDISLQDDRQKLRVDTPGRKLLPIEV